MSVSRREFFRGGLAAAGVAGLTLRADALPTLPSGNLDHYLPFKVLAETPLPGVEAGTLPAGTKAFYFYAEPQQFALLQIQATAQDGTTSGPIDVQGFAGAQYYGFYGTGASTLSSITVTTTDPTGFAVGEFGINGGVVIP